MDPLVLAVTVILTGYIGKIFVDQELSRLKRGKSSPLQFFILGLKPLATPAMIRFARFYSENLVFEPEQNGEEDEERYSEKDEIEVKPVE